MIKPNFQMLWQHFPDHIQYSSLKDLYTALGGAVEKNIHARGFGPEGNTCASRMSVAFNKAGAPIDIGMAKTCGAETLGTADGSRIIFRVSDLRKYLVAALGQPSNDKISPYDDAFRGRKGIIAFSVNWQGATGHIALWNGLAYREPSHDDYSTYINASDPNVKTSLGEFWELA